MNWFHCLRSKRRLTTPAQLVSSRQLLNDTDFWRMKSAAQLVNVTLVRRDDIPTLTTVVVDGVEHSLGILKDFRRHPQISTFLPEDGRLSLSWVRLEAGEKLEIHVHSVDSMIIVGHGKGQVLGDLEASFADGDIILIPRGR